MTDFVTRLEAELHQAALRRERAGRIRGVAVPRLRVTLDNAPAAALAVVLLGLAIVGVALMLEASPQRAAKGDVPPSLRGTWRGGTTELRLYSADSVRCPRLGLTSSKPCYTIGSAATHVADEWGEASVAGDQLTIQATDGGAPGSYRWRVERRALRLVKLSDPTTARAKALASEPLIRARREQWRPRLPVGWTAQAFASDLYGYSIRYPMDWSARAGAGPGKPDRLAPASSSGPLPVLTIVAQKVPAGTTEGHWSSVVNSRPEVGCASTYYVREPIAGVPGMLTHYPRCNGADEQWASFVHQGRGYTLLWRGKPGHLRTDGPRFWTLLRSIALTP